MSVLELGMLDQCRYPGFSEDPPSPFTTLLTTSTWRTTSSLGSAAVLRTGAASLRTAGQDKRAMAGYVGDVRQRQHLRERFRVASYGQVVAVAETLKYPDQMTGSERRMVKFARKKTLS